MNLVPVKSSNIQSVGYDPKTLVLEVKFNSGKHFRYLNVNPKVHDFLMQADSIGKYFSMHIRGHHTAEEVLAK